MANLSGKRSEAQIDHPGGRNGGVRGTARQKAKQRQVLLFHPDINPPGGGKAVAAWMMEALKDTFEIHLLSWTTPDLPLINRYFGTSLTDGDFIPICLPRHYRWLAEAIPDPCNVQRRNLLLRRAKKISDCYDLRICADNECDLGGPSIQYIHYPWLGTQFRQWQKSEGKTGIAGSLLALMRGQIRFWMIISTFSFKRVRSNLTLANSNWTARKTREIYDIPVITLYPPGPDFVPSISWEHREDGIVCAGRIVPCKQLERVIHVVEALRAAGRNVHLHLAGSKDVPGRDPYYSRIKSMAAQRSGWISWEENLSRRELLDLMARHRFGLHAMEDEPFGMAVAEMAAIGTLVFVPRAGGPLEIVGGEEELLYSGEQELLNKMCVLMNDQTAQLRISQKLMQKCARFSADQFCREFRLIAEGYVMALKGSKPQASISNGYQYDL
jgi:glycosyltransferase involved in cell wall biosynthesis